MSTKYSRINWVIFYSFCISKDFLKELDVDIFTKGASVYPILFSWVMFIPLEELSSVHVTVITICKVFFFSGVEFMYLQKKSEIKFFLQKLTNL